MGGGSLVDDCAADDVDVLWLAGDIAVAEGMEPPLRRFGERYPQVLYVHGTGSGRGVTLAQSAARERASYPQSRVLPGDTSHKARWPHTAGARAALFAVRQKVLQYCASIVPVDTMIRNRMHSHRVVVLILALCGCAPSRVAQQQAHTARALRPETAPETVEAPQATSPAANDAQTVEADSGAHRVDDDLEDLDSDVDLKRPTRPKAQHPPRPLPADPPGKRVW